MPYWMVLAALPLAWVACSDDEDTGATTASGSIGASTTASGATSGSATGGNGTGGGGTGGGGIGGSGAGGGDPACAALMDDVMAKLAAAQSCTGASNMECKTLLEGRCCDEVVAQSDTPANQDYLDALDALKQSGCPIDCPPEPCPMVNGGVCLLGGCVPFTG